LTVHIQEAVLSHVWRHGGRVFAVDTGEVLADDRDDPMRTVVRQVTGAAHQLERSLIASRMPAGASAPRPSAGFGSPPFGCRAEGRTLVLDEAEQAAVARAVALRRGGASLQAIAAALGAEGRPPRRGATWRPMTVKRMLSRAA